MLVSAADRPRELVSLLAKPDPLGYFYLLELLCRMAPWDNWGKDSSSPLRREGGSFSVLSGFYRLLLAAMGLKGTQADQDQQQQHQSPWWQLWKAAASTYASWTKAYVKALKVVATAAAIKQTAAGEAPTAAAMEAGVGGAAVGEVAAGWVADHHSKVLMGLVDVLIKVPAPVWWAIHSSAAVGTDHVRLQLLLLLWRARLVAATVEHLVPGTAAASGMVGSGEGTSRFNSSGSSSRSSGKCFSFRTSTDQGGFGSSTRADGKVEEGDIGASPVAPSRAGQEGTGPGLDPGSNSVEQEAPGRSSGLDAALMLALVFYTEVVAWNKSAAELAAAAAMPAGNEAGVPSGSSAPEPLDNNAQLLSQRLVHIPTSLPPSVASYWEHLHKSYDMDKMLDMGKEQLAGESQQCKLQLLHDLLRLAQLLLAEVPCTIGCSNPACVDLRGASEVKVSC